jgi:hypothetical protein
MVFRFFQGWETVRGNWEDLGQKRGFNVAFLPIFWFFMPFAVSNGLEIQ